MRWRGFGPAAVLGATADPPNELVQLEAALNGIGLLAADPTTTSVEPEPLQHGAVTQLLATEAGRRAPARRRVADRWLEEILYRAALENGLYAAVEDPHRTR